MSEPITSRVTIHPSCFLLKSSKNFSHCSRAISLVPILSLLTSSRVIPSAFGVSVRPPPYGRGSGTGRVGKRFLNIRVEPAVSVGEHRLFNPPGRGPHSSSIHDSLQPAKDFCFGLRPHDPVDFPAVLERQQGRDAADVESPGRRGILIHIQFR